MKRLSVASILFSVAVLFTLCGVSCAQTSPNLENGFKPYGSYDGSHLDTVNLMNGNLMLHAPLLPAYAQRGDFAPQYSLYLTSKNWFVSTQTVGNLPVKSWQLTPQSVMVINNISVSLHRTVQENGSGLGLVTYSVLTVSLNGPDDSVHQFIGVPGMPTAPNGDPTVYESIDGSAYHLIEKGDSLN